MLFGLPVKTIFTITPAPTGNKTKNPETITDTLWSSYYISESSVFNVFNRTPIPTENKTKNLKLNQFAVLIFWMAEPMVLLQYSYSYSSIPILIPVFLFLFQYSYSYSSIPILIPVFLFLFQYSYSYSSIPILIPVFLFLFLYFYSYSSIPILIPVFLFLFQYSYSSIPILILIPVFLFLFQYSCSYSSIPISYFFCPEFLFIIPNSNPFPSTISASISTSTLILSFVTAQGIYSNSKGRGLND